MVKKRMPTFDSAAEEAAFWDEHDTTDYFEAEDWQHLSLPDLAPSTKRITVRLPEGLLARLKAAGHRRGVPYQSLLKAVLYEWLEKEGGVSSGKRRRA